VLYQITNHKLEWKLVIHQHLTYLKKFQIGESWGLSSLTRMHFNCLEPCRTYGHTLIDNKSITKLPWVNFSQKTAFVELRGKLIMVLSNHLNLWNQVFLISIIEQWCYLWCYYPFIRLINTLYNWRKKLSSNCLKHVYLKRSKGKV